jgi:uncharacterized protein (TIRG00374 family)
MSGAAFFVSEARRRGYSTARAAVVGALFLEFDYLGLLAVLGLGLVVLIRRNDLNTTDVVASAILVCIAAGVALLLYLGMRSADALGKALGWMARAVNTIVRPFIKREYLSEQRAQGFAHDAAEGLREIRQEPRSMIMPLLLTLVNKTLLVLILLCSFLAFKVPVSIGTIIAGFSIAYLFVIVSPTPAGIGFVEGIMTLTLRSMYVPLEAATVITLTYRGITFWLPLLYGMFMFRWISKEKEKSS